MSFFSPQIIKGLVKRDELVRARIVLEGAIGKFANDPEKADAVRDARARLGEIYLSRENYEAARATYDEIVPPDYDLAMADRLLRCLRELEDYPAMLELAAGVRKSQPADTAEWWKVTVEALQKLVDDKKYQLVVDHCEALEKEEREKEAQEKNDLEKQTQEKKGQEKQMP